MSGFEVMTQGLMAASATVGGDDCDFGGARAAVLGSADALAGTPAALAYDSLLGSMRFVLSSLIDVSGELSAALAQAAVAYDLSDRSVAASMSHRGP